MASQLGDGLPQLGQLRLEVGPAQAGQAATAACRGCASAWISLRTRTGSAMQAGAGRRPVLRRPDGGDDGVDHVERLEQALDDVGPVLGLVAAGTRTAG